jgi:transketolase
MSQVNPLNIAVRLSPQPNHPPQFAIEMGRANGRKLHLPDPRATRAMVALMDMQAQLNGAASHWGGPSAFAELMSAVHGLMFDEADKQKKSWHELFHFVNDAGHCENGLYALRANYEMSGVNLQGLKKFRSIESALTGHGEAHLFPEGVFISNGPLGSGIPQAQGLAVAEALAGTLRTTVCAISDGGCMEGEAREALAAIPGLAHKKKLGPFLLLISDNNTKLSGRIDEDAFSMAPTFKSLSELGWKVTHLADGHDLEAAMLVIDQALQSLKADPTQPIAIHARTIKGFGVEKTMKSASGGHGFPLKEARELRGFLQEIYQSEPVPPDFLGWCEDLERGVGIRKPEASTPKICEGINQEKVQVGVAKALIDHRLKGFPIISVSADLPGSTGLADFQKKFPEATIDVGVAEANMISVATGLSKQGFIPIVDTFSQFGITKGNLPLIMSALTEGPVIGIFSHAGFQDAADGASHQALSYFSAVAAVPHTDCYCLTSSAEAEALVGQALVQFREARLKGRVPRSQIFFLGRENFPKRYLPEGYNYKLGAAQIVRDLTTASSARALTIAATGACLSEALLAAEKLATKGIETVVIQPSIIQSPDVKTFATAIAKTGGRLLTVEDHQVRGGMGALLVHALLRDGVNLQSVCSLGVEDQFGRSAYQALDLYRLHGLDSATIATRAEELVMATRN